MRQAANSGYTIIEVLIVLAISTSLMFAAILVFQGQQDQTVYTQTIQDFNSKLVNYANQVAAGTFPDSQQYDCDGSGPRPTLSKAASQLGGRQGCIFLGRAIQVKQNSGDITVYTILGKQNQADGDPATTIAEASPEPSIRTDGTCTASQPTCWVMSDSYSLAGGAKITSANAEDTSGAPLNNWYMTGIYITLDQNGGESSGALQQTLWGYQLNGSSAFYGTGSGGVKECIEDSGSTSGPTCTNGQISKWKLCLQNSSNSHSFLLSIKGGPAGVTTALTDNGC